VSYCNEAPDFRLFKLTDEQAEQEIHPRLRKKIDQPWKMTMVKEDKDVSNS